eukprot:gene17680-24031_t
MRLTLRAVCLAPAAVMDINLSRQCRSFMTSIVNASDLVPRIDIFSVALFVKEVSDSSPLRRAMYKIKKRYSEWSLNKEGKKSDKGNGADKEGKENDKVAVKESEESDKGKKSDNKASKEGEKSGKGKKSDKGKESDKDADKARDHASEERGSSQNTTLNPAGLTLVSSAPKAEPIARHLAECSAPKPEPTAGSVAESTSPKPEPTTEPVAESTSQKPERTTGPEAQSTSQKPEPTIGHVAESASPKPEPTTESVAESTSPKPEPTTEPVAESASPEPSAAGGVAAATDHVAPASGAAVTAAEIDEGSPNPPAATERVPSGFEGAPVPPTIGNNPPSGVGQGAGKGQCVTTDQLKLIMQQLYPPGSVLWMLEDKRQIPAHTEKSMDGMTREGLAGINELHNESITRVGTRVNRSVNSEIMPREKSVHIPEAVVGGLLTGGVRFEGRGAGDDGKSEAEEEEDDENGGLGCFADPGLGGALQGSPGDQIIKNRQYTSQPTLDQQTVRKPAIW